MLYGIPLRGDRAMRRYPITFVSLTAALLIISCTVVHAAGSGDTKISQMYVSGGTATVFADGPLNGGELTFAVSNIPAQIMEFGSLSDPNALIMTTILVDISTSMPRAARGVVIETLDALVESKAANEQFRLAIFGEELTMLTDFSPDRYDIAEGIESIEFNGDWSIVYNAVYDTIPDLEPLDGKPVLYRTVVSNAVILRHPDSVAAVSKLISELV